MSVSSTPTYITNPLLCSLPPTIFAMDRVTVVKTLSPQVRRRNGDGGFFLRPEPEEEEISIFDAKKYFNESGLEGNRVSPVKIGVDRSSEQGRDDFPAMEVGFGGNCRARSFQATPTASSEASWNSQTGLLRNPPGGVPVNGGEKKSGSAARWLFGRKCPCSGKKSVEVSSEPRTGKHRLSVNQSSESVVGSDSRKPSSESENPKPETVSISISQKRNHRFSSETASFHSERVSAPAATGFTFPILSQSKLVLPSSVPADPPRDSVESLEVFRPSNHHHRHVPPIFTFPANPKSRVTMAEDDVASDASSDLFEIESFSTQTTATTSYPMMRPRRDSLDEAASYNPRRLSGGGARQSLDEAAAAAATTECYEPSEASIDWSVTTAEGFDRGSVTSYTVARVEAEEVVYEKGGGGGKKRGSGGLLSCRCEKAVSVGPHPQPVARWVPPTARQGQVGDWATGGVGHRKPPSGSPRLPLGLVTVPL